MGYERKPKVYKLVFDDPEMAGFEMRARSITVSEYLDVVDVIAAVGPDLKVARRESRERLGELFRLITDATVEWNLEKKGVPVPVGPQALFDEDSEFSSAIVGVWMTEVAGIGRPLGRASNSGPPSAEASLPMELLSESQPN